jgi:hypothetical protein
MTEQPFKRAVVKQLRHPETKDAPYEVFGWTFDDWAAGGLSWTKPASFVIYSNGDWAIKGTVHNGHIVIGAPTKASFWFETDYVNAKGEFLGHGSYPLYDNLGQGDTANASNQGNDANFVHWLPQIAFANNAYQHMKG